MGGEGTMMAANQSLKANRDSRRKDRRTFSVFVSGDSEKPVYNFPRASKEKLVKLREKLQHQNKIRNLKISTFVVVALSFLLTVFFYFF